MISYTNQKNVGMAHNTAPFPHSYITIPTQVAASYNLLKFLLQLWYPDEDY